MNLFRPFATLLLASAVSLSAVAEERGTKEEAKTMADSAVEHVKKVGPEQAFKDFNTDKAKWTKKDLYVFAFDMKGLCLAHGANEKLVGKNLDELKDQNGKLFVREMATLATGKGVGWVDYEWAHPQTKKVEDKTSYVRKLANYDGYVGVGFFR
jgi:cytochrome c